MTDEQQREMQSQAQHLMDEKQWQAIMERAADGKATQEDVRALIEECTRLGKQALGWRQLVRVWQEYAEGMRRAMMSMRQEMIDDVQ